MVVPTLTPRVRVVLLTAVLAVLFAAPAPALAAPPAVTLDKRAPERQLFGTDAQVTLRAANPAGQPYGYNLTFRDVLPAGVSYVPGSAPIEPRVLADAPTTGRTTLLWENVSDLSPNSAYELSYEVRHSRTLLDAGHTYTNEAVAYVHEDPRFLPKFDVTGAAVPDAGVGSAADDADTLLTAVEIEKDEPSPEGELLRGVHDHKTVYTLRVRNNDVNATTGITVDDWLPAGLEYLACATADHGGLEFPGAPPLDASAPAAPDCRVPTLVDTELVDPDGAGPLALDVYTHVRWSAPNLAPGATYVIQYVAAVPIFENVTDFGALEPTPASGQQAANLDNNTGSETADEQALTNYARASGTYNGGPTVFDEDWLTRTAEDIAIQKHVDTDAIQQGGLSEWRLELRASEYRSVANIRVTDTLPDGLCPLGDENYENPVSDSAECDPAGPQPSLDYATVQEQSDGSFTLTWNAPDLPPSGTATITFPTRTRAMYQDGFEDDAPVLTRDAWTNEVELLGADSTPPGIPTTEADGTDDVDASAATQEAGSITIDKQVRQPDGAMSCDGGGYGDSSAQAFGPGDIVCWRLRVMFPSALDTGEPDVIDFLPAGSTYAGDMLVTSTPGNATVTPIGAIGDNRLVWQLRNGTGDVESGGQVFEVQFKSQVGGPGSAESHDILGNLQKVVFSNTGGTTFPLRDQADFEYEEAELQLRKGVRQVDGGTVHGPDVDDQPVNGGDVVTYRVDIDEVGGRAAGQIEVWDELPDGVGCGDVDLASISDGGTCDVTEERIEWTNVSVAAEGTRMLTYDVTIPSTFGPEARLVNHAGIRGYTSATNGGGTVAYVPADNIDPSHPDTPNAPAADDDADVRLRAVTVAKTAETEVTEAGNDLAAQATIGEEIDYEITTTIPNGTTLYGSPAFTDALDARQTFKPGSLTVTLNGADITGDGSYTISTAGNTISVAFPSGYTSGAGDDVLSVGFTVRVNDVPANVRGAALPNSASFTFTDAPSGGAVHTPTDSVSTTIVEPLIDVAKADDEPDNRVLPGQDITYTVTASHAAGSNRSPAHDTLMVDVVPEGLTPVSGGVPVDDGDTVGGGVWDETARTITWTVGTLVPGTPVSRSYVARVDNPAAAATTFVNTVTLTGSSLGAAYDADGDRTEASVTNAGYRDTAQQTMRIAAATVDKGVSPATATVGDRVTYTVDVLLRANVDYPDAALLDTLPDGIDFVESSSVTCLGGCGLTATPLPPAAQADGSTRLGWWIGDAGSAAADRTIRIVYVARVDDRREPETTPVVAGNALSNSAQATYNSTDTVVGTPLSVPAAGTFDETSNLDTATVTVAEPAVTLDKDVSGDPDDDDARATQPGDAYTYTILVRNTGDAPAYDVRVADQPDDDLVAVVPTDGAGLVTDGWTAVDPAMEWRIPGPIAPGATVTLRYTAALGPTSGLSDGEAIANTADVPEYWGVPAATRTLDGFDYRTYTAVPDDTVTLTVDLPQLAVSKTTGLPGNPETGDAEIGQAYPWRITVTNTATTAVAHDVALTDVLPADWAVVGGSVSPAPTSSAGGTLSWDNIGDLAPGQSAVFTLSAVPSEAAGAHADPQLNAATATAEDGSGAGGYTDDDTASATLRSPVLELTKTPDAATRHAGAATTWTVQVRNTGDGTARDVTIEDTLPPGVTYAPNSATAAPAGGFSEVSASGAAVTWELAALAPGASVDITVPVTLDAGLAAGTVLTNTAAAHADEATTPVSDTGSFDVTTQADVRIAKVGDVAAIDAGDVLSYTLTATNDGPSDAHDVVVTDALPADVTFVDVEAPCTQAAGTVMCVLGTLAAGDSEELTLRVRVLPGVTGSVANTAEITTSTDDPNSANDADTETTTVGALADLSLTKLAAAPQALAGQTAAFTLRVRNDGPSDAADVVVTDPLPAGAGFVTAGSDGRCAEAGGTISCTIGTLADGATEELIVVLRVDTIGPLTNVATVTSTTPDPDGGDRTDDAEIEVLPATDLSAAKTGPATIGADEVATYTLTARNDGPSDATGVVLRDTLPAGTVFDGAVPGGACTAAGGEVTCPVGALANGAEASVQVRVAVPAALGGQTLLNSVRVTGDQGDPDPSGDTATASTDVGPAVDLRVTKATPGAAAGGDVTWTVGVVNAGPSTATGVELVDALPEGVAYVAAVAGQGGCKLDGRTVRCALGTLPVNGAAQVTITARVDAALAGTAIANTATARAAEPEVHPPDNAGTATFTVAAPAPRRVALDVAKVASTRAPRLGQPFSYVIRARNPGGVEAPAVAVTDALAAPLDLVAATASQGTCEGGRVVRCSLGSIPAGGEASVTVRVVPRRGGKVRNFATVDSAGTEVSPESLGAVAGVDVRAERGTLRLSKRALRGSVRAGGKVRFALVVRSGKRALQDVRVCDRLPATLALVSARGAKLRSGRPCWRWSYLPAQAKRVVHVTVRVAPGATGASVRNTAVAQARNARRRGAADRVRVHAQAPRGGGVTG